MVLMSTFTCGGLFPAIKILKGGVGSSRMTVCWFIQKRGLHTTQKFCAKHIIGKLQSMYGGEDTKGRTWEYIYFLKDLQEVSIPKEVFSAFFGYKINFTPQGFSNIDKEKLDIRMRRYTILDELVNNLSNKFILSEDDLEENNFQTSLESDFSKIPIDSPEIKQRRKNPKKINGMEAWPRSAKISKIALKKANFKCEIDQSHITFVSDASKELYVEAHHLIPMKFQNEFTTSIDTESNVVALCPLCHRKIHLARKNEKKELLQILYNKRIDLLRNNVEIDISLKDLYGFYAIN